jgi:hypothetical protein
MDRPQASKIVHLLVSVGPDDSRTMSEFEEVLKNRLAGHGGQGKNQLVTVVGVQYLSEGKTYSVPAFEAWDGDEATKPRSMFDHSEGPALVEPTTTGTVQKSPAEALRGVKRTPKRARKIATFDRVVRDDEPAPKHTKRTGNDRKNDAIDDREVTDIEGVDDDWGSW